MTSKVNSKIKKILREFSEDIEAFHLVDSSVHIYYDKIDTKKFKEDYVSKNFPVLIKNGVKHWPATNKWNSDYFRNCLGEKKITVTITPNGYADGISNKNGCDYFVLPYETEMKFSEFIHHLSHPKDDMICYIQKQNSNLTEDFPEFIADISDQHPWAEQTFGPPDAVNFWMGDSRAITSMHKDPYENIYSVISGRKDFILIPPTDVCWVPYRNYPKGKYVLTSENQLVIEDLVDDESIPWISIDPLNPDLQMYPDYANAKIFKISVEAGDCLYLPSLWFHHVRQSHRCIAVNHWYDMNYDYKYCLFNLLEKLSKLKM